MFLSETLAHANKVEEIKRTVGFNNCFVVDREGKSGGLALFWNNKVNCQIMNYSMNFINVMVIDDNNKNWRFTYLYGFLESHRRKNLWNMLRNLSSLSSLPWCVIGNFNDVLSQMINMEESIIHLG